MKLGDSKTQHPHSLKSNNVFEAFWKFCKNWWQKTDKRQLKVPYFDNWEKQSSTQGQLFSSDFNHKIYI